MLYVLGDIHGSFHRLNWMLQFIQPDDTIIQVGDFGFSKTHVNEFHKMFPDGYRCKIYAIEGNHEDYTLIDSWSKTDITDIGSNLFYVPRGYVMEYNGKLMGFMGGAESIDKAYREEGHDWFPQERITREDEQRLYANVGQRTLDYLFSHTPPISTIHANFGKLIPEEWMLPYNWQDESSKVMEDIHSNLRPRAHYCGHMHRTVRQDVVYILDIDEVKAL